ncbi:MAG: hypothetical protein ACYCXW_05145 [Solirubrobacteraceae bacterium]
MPPDSIDCAQLKNAQQAGTDWVQSPMSGDSSYMLTCDPKDNLVSVVAAAFVQGRIMIPTNYGDFWVLLSTNLGPFTLAQLEAGVLPDLVSISQTKLTCPTVQGAEQYVWEVNNIFDSEYGQTIRTDLLPGNATVTCAAIGPFGVIGTVQMLVDHGRYVQAATTVSGGSNASTALAR